MTQRHIPNPGPGKSARTIIRILIILLVSRIQANADIVLEGFVPHEITKASVMHEYRRIWDMLSLRSPPDTSALTVTYFATKGEMRHSYSLPEWGGGGAVGTGRIVVALDAEPFIYADFMQITVHELTHIVINRLCPEHVPRWFHEGTAMLCAGDVTFGEQAVLSQAILTGNLLNLSSIDSVNAFGPFRARLAYAQGHQSVLFLVDSYGMDVLKEILYYTAQTGSFDAGLTATLQITATELEAMTRAWLMKQFRMAFFFADTYLLWALILLLFIAGYVMTRYRNRKGKEAMEMQEAQESGTGDT